MTVSEKEQQTMDFAYGNLACSTNHKPSREAFWLVAQDRGWSREDFESWANARTWERA